jgi:AcrR family transcriptional regulator
MDAGPVTRTRRRDAAATRTALLNAARTLMAQHGVEGTSTREVAAAAGVNQALVYRYFGSKEQLFTEAATTGVDPADDLIANTPLAELPRLLLDRVLEVAEQQDAGEFATLVAAANDETVRKVLRTRIEAGFTRALAARLAGPDAELRAELVASILVGVGFLRHKIGTKAMSTADRETLGTHVDRMAGPLLG